MPTIPEAKISAAFFADAHKKSDSGKTDAFGLFDRFRVWGVPATRECSIVARIEHIPEGQSSFHVFMQDRNRRRKEIAKLVIDSKLSQPSVITAVRGTISLDKKGANKIGIQSTKGVRPRIHWIPFVVDLMPWIELPTGEILQKILLNPNTIKAMRASLKCTKCQKLYTFELNVNPDAKRDRGVRPFPETGKFKCPHCSAIHQLRDIEGQLRYHLSNQGEGGNE